MSLTDGGINMPKVRKSWLEKLHDSKDLSEG